ncbi:MAG: hypothetical protein AB1345_04090 [Chloroflexota bacterium]
MLRPKSLITSLTQSNSLVLVGLIGANLFFNIIANSGFKLSATSSNWRGFISWQIIGNLAGFLAVLTLTGLLHHLPLHVVYPISMGLAIIGVQLVAARMFFHEPITITQWMGSLLVVGGIILISKQ